MTRSAATTVKAISHTDVVELRVCGSPKVWFLDQTIGQMHAMTNGWTLASATTA